MDRHFPALVCAVLVGNLVSYWIRLWLVTEKPKTYIYQVFPKGWPKIWRVVDANPGGEPPNFLGADSMDRKQNKKQPVSAEVLEQRTLLSSISLTNGALNIQGDRGDNQISVTEDTVNSAVTVNLDGKTQSFSRGAVQSLSINGGNGDDVLENRTSLDAAILGGSGNDVIRGGSGDDFLSGGSGNDVINEFGGDNTLDGGSGNDTLQTVSSGRDFLSGGNGNDSLYAIVGAANTVIGGNGRDQFIVRDGVETTDARRNQDTLVAFRFDEPGVTLRDGTLYLMGGGTAVVNQVGDQLIVTANGVTTQFDAKDVKGLAGIGSQANDVFINNTTKDSVYYGIGGDDLLQGGSGNDLLKGGAGNDVIVGNAGADDISGDAGSDTIIGGQGRDKLRFDALDSVFADARDLLVLA